jgi:hypothetical protein
MGVHEDRGFFLRNGEEEVGLRNPADIGSFSNQEGCCLSKYKVKNRLRKIFTETTREVKLKITVSFNC